MNGLRPLVYALALMSGGVATVQAEPYVHVGGEAFGGNGADVLSDKLMCGSEYLCVDGRLAGTVAASGSDSVGDAFSAFGRANAHGSLSGVLSVNAASGLLNSTTVSVEARNSITILGPAITTDLPIHLVASVSGTYSFVDPATDARAGGGSFGLTATMNAFGQFGDPGDPTVNPFLTVNFQDNLSTVSSIDTYNELLELDLVLQPGDRRRLDIQTILILNLSGLGAELAADFGHTFKVIALDLPEGYSFTSLSGTFLTPLPGTLPLLAACASGLGWLGRRRHRATPVA